MSNFIWQIGPLILFAITGYGVLRLARVVPPRGPALPDTKKAGAWALVALLFTYLVVGGIMLLAATSRSGSEMDSALKTVDQIYTPGMVANILLSYLIFVLPTALVMRLRHEPLASAGIRRKNLLASLLVALLLGGMIVCGTALFSQQPLVRLSAGHFWAFLYFLVVGFGEEFIFRGYLQTRLSDWLGRWQGWLLASTAMALLHIGQRIAVGGLDFQQALVSSISLLPISLLLGVLMLWSGNLALPGVLHMFMDWVNTLLGSV